MKLISKLVIVIMLVNPLVVSSQMLTGKITSNGVDVPFANIILKDSGIGVSSNRDGFYKLEKLKKGYYQIIISSLGMKMLALNSFLNSLSRFWNSFNLR